MIPPHAIRDTQCMAGTPLRDFGRRVEDTFNEAKPRVEEELKRVIAYLNDEVVPEVRQSSSKALKIAAKKLTKLAERMDRGAGPTPKARE